MRRARRRSTRAAARRRAPRLSRDRCCSACLQDTRSAPTLTLPFGVLARVVATRGPRSSSKRPRSSDPDHGMTRIHLIGICGTAMGTLAALLKQPGFDVRGSDQNVYPPMSDFLRQQGITTLQGYHAEHIGTDLDLVVVGNAISRGNVELEEVLDRKIRYCSLPEAVRDHFLWGGAVDRHRGHARQDHDDVADRLAADPRRRRSERVHRRHRRELRQQLPPRRRPRVRDRGRRIRQRVLRQDREVPQVPAGHRRRQQYRVRPRGHLPGPRRRSG